MKGRGWRLLAVLLLALSFGLVACKGGKEEAPAAATPAAATPVGEIPPIPAAPEAPGVSEDRILLGHHMALTGTMAQLSKVIMPGLMDSPEALFDYINDHGGVCGGRKIEWRVVDDQSTAEGALSAVKRLAEVDHVFAFFFNIGEAIHNPRVVEYLNKNRIPDMYVITGGRYASEKPLDYRFMFRGLTNYYSEGKVIAQFIQEQFPGKRVALFEIPQYEISTEASKGAKDGLEGTDNPVVAEVEWSMASFDLTPQVMQLRDAHPDIVVGYFSPSTTGMFLDGMEKSGVPLEDWILIGPSAASDLSLFEVVPAEKVDKLRGFYAPIFGALDLLWNHDPRFDVYRDILKQYKPDLKPDSTYTFWSFHMAMLMVETLERACREFSLTREGLVAAAESFKGDFKYIPEQLKVTAEVSPVERMAMGPTDHVPYGGWVMTRAQQGKWSRVSEKTYHVEEEAGD